MMQRGELLAGWHRHRCLIPAAASGLVIALLAVYPFPLLPLVRAYQVLCGRYPGLSLLTFRAPPPPVALLFTLAGLGIVVGIGSGVVALLQTHRFNQRVRRSAATPPLRLVRLAAELGIADSITYLAWTQPAAYCYGFTRPDIAITAGLVARLDDEELIAVLAHERQHLRRRDPVRYLVLYAVSAAAFMLPVAAALRQRREARIELAADRAALAVAPRGALAGALLVVLDAPRLPVRGVAGLTATEARIAHLSGRAVMPDIPARLVLASVGLVAVVVLAAVNLAASAELVERVCEYCADMT
jgi:Zn-dependent protease with chaperone function